MRPRTRTRSRLATAASVLALAVVALLAASATAAAANPSYSCRASALRVDGLGLVAAEPAVANGPGAPCTSESTTNVTLPAALASLLSLGATSVSTTEAASSGSAQVSVAGTTVAGALQVGLLEASAAYACVNGAAVPSSSSRVADLRLLGTPVTLDQDGHASLLGLGDIWVNQTITGPAGITRRALTVQLLPTIAGGATIVLGEASAAALTNCATGGGNPGPGPGDDGGGGDTGRRGGGGGGGTGDGGGPSGNCSTPAGCFGGSGSGSGGSGDGGNGSGGSGGSGGADGTDGSGVIYSNDRPFQLPVTAFPGVTYACAVDNGPFRPCTAPFRFDLKDGSHTIQLRGTDQSGRSAVSTFRTFIDSKQPTAGTLYPVCRNATRGRASRRATRRCAGTASNWRTLRGRVADPGPSSGIAKVGVNLVRRTGRTCSVLTPARRFQTMACASAQRVFVTARLGVRGFSRTTFRRGRRGVGIRTQIARWSLRVPITRGAYRIRTTASDRAGNQQVRFNGRSSIGLRLR